MQSCGPVVYNGLVKTSTSGQDVIRLVRFSSMLWLGYLAVLSLITHSMSAPRRGSNEMFLYYILLGLVALLCLGLAYWPWLQRWLGHAFIPTLIAIITIGPVLVNNLVVRLSPLGPRFGSPEGSLLAMLPFLFVALLLVAWQYRWHAILLVILVFAALNLAIAWSSARPGAPPLQGAIAITLIQTVIFLAVGFSISFLISRLREQQRSLEAANVQLTHHASTLEQLATSRERNRLALELHDTLAHTLSGLSVQLETIKAYWEIDPAMARSLLEKSLASTHAGLEETRRTLRALRAGPLEDLGLALALATMAKEITTRAGIALDMPEVIMMPPLSPDIEQCIYRVAQEALTNVAKHAKAKKVTVKLEAADSKAVLTVSDDGVGFDLAEVNETGHFGLAGMRERAQAVGGNLEVISARGQGTTIRLTVNEGKTA